MKTLNGVLALGVFLLAGCGGSSSTQKPTAAEGEISSTSAATFKSSSGDQVISTAQPKPDAGTLGANPSSTRRSSPLMLIPEYRNIARFFRTDDCEPTKSSTTDADSDGIPAEATWTFSCDTTTGGGFTLTASGSIAIKDGDDADKKSGFTFKINNVSFHITGSIAGKSYDITATITGDFAVTVSSTTITSSGNVQVSVSSDGKTTSFGYWGDVTATGTSAEDPFAAGTITLDNWYRFELESTKYVLHITSTDLTYGSCTREDGRTEVSLNGGKLTIVDGKPNTLTVTFNAACTATWTYNGETL